MTKRKSLNHKDPPNLKRFKKDVDKFNDTGGDGVFGMEKRHSWNKLKKLKPGVSRKQQRKEERKLKKERKLIYSQKRPVLSVADMKLEKKRKEKDLSDLKKAAIMQKLKAKRKKRKIRIKERDIQEKQEHRRAEIEREEKTIKQLSKQLKLDKRKNKSLPKAFLDDGLDYILDVTDESKVKMMYQESEESGSESGDSEVENSDNSLKKKKITESEEANSETDNSDAAEEELADWEEDKFETDDSDSEESSIHQANMETKAQTLNKPDISSSGKLKDVKLNQKSILRKNTSRQSEIDKLESSKVKSVKWGENVLSNESSESESGSAIEEEVESSEELDGKGDKPILREDIYGRLRDEAGNVVRDTSTSGAYVPPGKRLQMAGLDEKKKLHLERLRKQIKGLVNRASESNMQPITTQIETFYQTNSRADVNECLVTVVLDACVSPSLTPERLSMELMMMVAILHGNVGTDVGAVFIQNLAQKFDELFQLEGNYGSGKEMDNVIMLFCQIYNFKVFHNVLIVDIMKKLTESFQEKDIELLLLMLRNVGFTLRKDDPAVLKELILQVQSKASAADTSTFKDESRVKFMLDVLLAVKNNNLRKIPNYDPDHLDHLKKLIRNFIRGTSLGDGQLRIGLSDLLDAETRGRWWVVGSAWEARLDVNPELYAGQKASGEVSGKILELARKQRMNTSNRKNIFCILMTSEDFVDAFDKILHLGLKPKQEREIIHVIVDCCLQEKTFNLYYAYLAQKFCEYHRRFQITFQCTLWDKFKEMGNLSKQNRANLSQLLIHLLATKALSLSVLKVIEFGTLEKSMVRFLKETLTGILVNYQQAVMEAVFLRIALLSKLHVLQEGLKLFMHHFLLHKKSKGASTDTVLVERIKLAEKILSSGQSKMLL